MFKLRKILGHSSAQMTERYVHLASDAYAKDYGRLSDATPTEEDNVVNIDVARMEPPASR